MGYICDSIKSGGLRSLFEKKKVEVLLKTRGKDILAKLEGGLNNSPSQNLITSVDAKSGCSSLCPNSNLPCQKSS